MTRPKYQVEVYTPPGTELPPPRNDFADMAGVIGVLVKAQVTDHIGKVVQVTKTKNREGKIIIADLCDRNGEPFKLDADNSRHAIRPLAIGEAIVIVRVE